MVIQSHRKKNFQSEREYDVNVYRLQRMMELLESITMVELPFDNHSFVSKI